MWVGSGREQVLLCRRPGGGLLLRFRSSQTGIPRKGDSIVASPPRRKRDLPVEGTMSCGAILHALLRDEWRKLIIVGEDVESASATESLKTRVWLASAFQ
jgi:hypothetical protein